MTDTRLAPAPSGISTNGSTHGRGFHPASRRRHRIALGVLLVAVAIGANLLVYAGLDRAEPAVQVVADVPAGSQLTADMLRTVDVDADPSVNVVDGDDINALVGQYAKVRLVAGSLVTREALQPGPLVSPGTAVVALQLADGSLPIGLRERVPVQLVIPAGDGTEEPRSIDGRVVGLPRPTSDALGLVSLSVEVLGTDAALVAAADDVRVVLVEPAPDPAQEPAD